MKLRDDILFYVALPGLVGLLFGFNQVGVAQYFTLGVSILFWVVTSLATWAIFHVVTLSVAHLLKPWSPLVAVTLAVGMLAASAVARVFIYFLADVFEPLMLYGRKAHRLAPIVFDLPFLAEYLRLWGGMFTLWMAANLFAHYALGIRKYQPATASAPAPAPAPLVRPPAAQEPTTPVLPSMRATFLGRLPPHLGTDLVALKSEDHYLRVFTTVGDTLVLYRLNDAIAELEALGVGGVRAHRSYWVATAAVADVTPEGRGYSIRLSNGLAVPVSQTYKEFVRLAGLAPIGRRMTPPRLARAD